MRKKSNLGRIIGILSEEQGKELDHIHKETKINLDIGLKKRAKQIELQ